VTHGKVLEEQIFGTADSFLGILNYRLVTFMFSQIVRELLACTSSILSLQSEAILDQQKLMSMTGTRTT